jgi:ATP-dependent Clp protease ATP-binding subunit ClpA
VSVFGSQAANAIALAEDEARILGRAMVEPEHLLLAILRRGEVRDMLRGEVSANDVYGAIVERNGLGDELVLGPVPRSRRLDRVLAEAIDIAGQRGERQVETTHLLLALLDQAPVAQLMEHFGIGDVTALMDEHSPPRDGRVPDEMSRLQRVRTELGESQRQIDHIVPVFERFTGDARRAVRASLESASLIEHREVDPFHLLIGCALVPESFAGRVLRQVFGDDELGTEGELLDRAMRMGPPPFHQATGILSEATRRVVTEDA